MDYARSGGEQRYNACALELLGVRKCGAGGAVMQLCCVNSVFEQDVNSPVSSRHLLASKARPPNR